MNQNFAQQPSRAGRSLAAIAGLLLLSGGLGLALTPGDDSASAAPQAIVKQVQAQSPTADAANSAAAIVSWDPSLEQDQVMLCAGPPNCAPCPSPAQLQNSPIKVGVDSADPICEGELHWNARRPIPWQIFAQGEYVGPARLQHVPEYRLRVDDELEFVYRLTRNEMTTPYRLNVGDQVRVESLTDPNLNRDLVIQPDGSITVLLLGQVHAARKTVTELTDLLDQDYKRYYKVPAITVTPLQVNTKLEDLRATVDSRAGRGGQSQSVRVTPEGTIQLPAIESVPAQGLTLDELKREVDERYAQVVDGIGVTPILTARAPRYLYVLGEVKTPGRFELVGPTTVMQSIALAGGWNVGGNLREVVIFRRAEDWRLVATKVDIQGALYGKRPIPSDELWLRDSDIVVVPKQPILWADEFIDLVFTRGIYGVAPFNGISITFSDITTL
ncbi:polysaccharide biosynthesis/export family protein [Blastopirellula marina]|uniref:Probable polysaccharide export protein n=1 Tax=Blastopirellula marina DSM 3645 TaxID=314230 RepID=A3ZTS6_9BACT|nr:polysaccharide biosynthesis/export family protein [Blastopirellula marina]EAQ79980.1 probable polysaccharide export protein [Blastopirellula marina DSM 3645]